MGNIMKDLFSFDLKDYDEGWKVFSRPSARAIIIRDDKVLLIYSKKYNYYKFPGGGIEKGETNAAALVREVLEETGYKVIAGSIKDYGKVLVKHADTFEKETIFEQENFYYLCDVEDEINNINLDDYEKDEEFTACFIEPFKAFGINKKRKNIGGDKILIEREAGVLDSVDLLIRERLHNQKRDEVLDTLGSPEFKEMFYFVKNMLDGEGTEDIGSKVDINYSRSEHTYRVINWAKRLYDEATDKEELRYEDLMIATIFHDVGRQSKLTKEVSHAKAGVPITREYLNKHGYSNERIEYICYLVGAHSDKHLMRDKSVDRNLLLLMEADSLDDMGAQGIVMDAMITEKRNPNAGFVNCFDHMEKYTRRLQRENPMETPEAKRMWDEKTALVEKFLEALKFDLGL